MPERGKIAKRLVGRFNFSNLAVKERLRKVVVFVQRRPITSFLIALLALFLLIVLGNFLFRQKTEEAPKKAGAQPVSVYTIGQTPTVKVQAQVQKDGVIVIMAQSPGVVQDIAVKEGDTVSRGTNLVSLSTNYQGGNAPSLQRQLAQVQYQNVKDTFETQKDIIKKQKTLAEKNANNQDQLRQISSQTLSDTNNLISINNTILNTINGMLSNLAATNSAGFNNSQIFQTQQLQVSYQGAVNQLNAQSRELSYTTNTGNPPAQISNLTKDIAIKQLDVQEKSLVLSKQIAQIQLNLAFINESLMLPASPCPGIVQKVNVTIGQQVNPGTPLITIYATSANVSAMALVPRNIAQSISRLESSNLSIGSHKFAAIPFFVSSQATDGQLYSIMYAIPDELQSKLTDQGFITVEIPIGHVDSNPIVPFIPIDAVFQTQDESLVYVVKKNKAVSKKVTLGSVLGNNVEITSGLKDGDQIILNRNIIAGDKVKVE